MLEDGFNGGFELCETLNLAVTRGITFHDSLVVMRPHDLSRGEVDEEAGHGDLKIDDCILREGQREGHKMFFLVWLQGVAICKALWDGHDVDQVE